ncbi:MAG: hypothetical protein ACOYYS_11330 [Chloroflexota bacterium]
MDYQLTENHLETLSITARLGVALVCFEKYCRVNDLLSNVEEFLEYLWKFPVLQTPGEFAAWETKRPRLVEVGLGEILPIEIQYQLRQKHVDPQEFATLLQAIVEIGWGSFYGAANNKDSLSYLKRVITFTVENNISIPPMSPFLVSRFSDRHGWGNQLTETQRNEWRCFAKA